MPAVRDEVLEEGHEIARGCAVCVELCSIVHDVVQRDGEKGSAFCASGAALPPGNAASTSDATQRAAGGAAVSLEPMSEVDPHPKVFDGRPVVDAPRVAHPVGHGRLRGELKDVLVGGRAGPPG